MGVSHGGVKRKDLRDSTRGSGLVAMVATLLGCITLYYNSKGVAQESQR
jgi:hypothetical protein